MTNRPKLPYGLPNIDLLHGIQSWEDVELLGRQTILALRRVLEDEVAHIPNRVVDLTADKPIQGAFATISREALARRIDIASQGIQYLDQLAETAEPKPILPWLRSSSYLESGETAVVYFGEEDPNANLYRAILSELQSQGYLKGMRLTSTPGNCFLDAKVIRAVSDIKPEVTLLHWNPPFKSPEFTQDPRSRTVMSQKDFQYLTNNPHFTELWVGLSYLGNNRSRTPSYAETLRGNQLLFDFKD